MLLQLGHKERQMAFSGKLFYMDNKTTKAEERTSVEICKSRVRQVQIVHTEGKPPRESRSHDRVVLKSLCVGLSFCQLMLYKSDKLLVVLTKDLAKVECRATDQWEENNFSHTYVCLRNSICKYISLDISL